MSVNVLLDDMSLDGFGLFRGLTGRQLQRASFDYLAWLSQPIIRCHKVSNCNP